MVEIYGNLKTTPNVRQGNFATNVDADLLSQGGKNISKLGNTLMGAANAAAEMEIDAQNRANQVRVNDFKNRLMEEEFRLKYDKEAGYTNAKGLAAFERESGKPLADEYGETYNRTAGDLIKGLGNEAQRQMAKEYAQGRITSFRGETMAYENEQFKNYTISVNDGTIANSMRNIGLNYNNIKVIDENVMSIEAAVYDKSILTGKSAIEAQVDARKAKSAAHLTALDAAIQENNPRYADAYLTKYSKDMDADDILKANALVTKQLDSSIAMETVQEVFMDTNRKLSTSDSDRAFNVAVQTESNGRQFAKDGTPLTSSAGAIGIAQVMPKTAPEAAKMAGLEWDEERYKNDSEYNHAIGKAYFETQLKDFNGNLAYAYAAYNAGPGATRKALDKAESSGTFWLDNLPAETQNYVRKNMENFNNGKGQYERPTLAEVHLQVREKIGNNNPSRLKLAIDEATRQYEVTTKSIKDTNDRAVSTAMKAVMENGGSYASLPPQVQNAIPPTEIGKVMDFAKKVAKGDDSTNLKVYQELSTDTNKLKNMSDEEFFAYRKDLSESDFKHFLGERNALKGISTSESRNPESIDSASVTRVLNDRLQMIGMSTTKTDEGDIEYNPQRMGAIRKFVNDSVLAKQMAEGKKLSDAEITKHIDYLFTLTNHRGEAMFTSTGGWFQNAIPSSTDAAITERFKKSGIEKPTEAQKLTAYWTLISAKGKK